MYQVWFDVGKGSGLTVSAECEEANYRCGCFDKCARRVRYQLDIQLRTINVGVQHRVGSPSEKLYDMFSKAWRTSLQLTFEYASTQVLGSVLYPSALGQQLAQMQ